MKLKKRLGNIFSESPADALLLMNSDTFDSNFLYLTGFTSGVFEDAILIARRESMTLLTNSLEYQTAMEQRPAMMKVVSIGNRAEMQKSLRKELEGRTVGINESFLSVSRYKALKKMASPKRFIGIGKELQKARAVKDEDEIASIRKAVWITKKAMNSVESMLEAGMTEKQLAAKFDYVMESQGSQKNAFDTIVSFGANAAMPHHMPDMSKLRENSIVLVDAGAKWDNYCADMTRTFVFRPDRKSEKFKKIEDMIRVVSDAQRAGFENIRDGAQACDAHNAAADVIDKAHNGIYKGRFIHSLGHSVGIDVHDGYIGLAASLKMKLKAGMVLSDEPGIYIPGFGGVRIEDDVLVKRNGADVL